MALAMSSFFGGSFSATVLARKLRFDSSEITIGTLIAVPIGILSGVLFNLFRSFFEQKINSIVTKFEVDRMQLDK